MPKLVKSVAGVANVPRKDTASMEEFFPYWPSPCRLSSLLQKPLRWEEWVLQPVMVLKKAWNELNK